MSKLWIMIALMFVLVGCAGGIATPCDDSDPVGICANSHGKECVC